MPTFLYLCAEKSRDNSRDVAAEYYTFMVGLKADVPELRYNAGYRNFLARLLHGLAIADLQMGNADNALARWREALSIIDDYDMSYYTMPAGVVEDKCKMLGSVRDVYCDRQDFDTAWEYNEQALALRSATYRRDLARKGAILASKGETKAALKLWKKLNADYPDANWSTSLFHKVLVEKQLIEP